jgi:type 1 fimbria pilin
MNNLIKIALILLIAFVTGCYYDSEEQLYPKLSSPCDDVNVTFSGTVKTILQSCQTCHSNANAASSGGGVRLQDFNNILTYAKNGKLMGTVSHSQGYIPMPEGGAKIPECEINQLQKWIDNGTLNN